MGSRFFAIPGLGRSVDGSVDGGRIRGLGGSRDYSKVDDLCVNAAPPSTGSDEKGGGQGLYSTPPFSSERTCPDQAKYSHPRLEASMFQVWCACLCRALKSGHRETSGERHHAILHHTGIIPQQKRGVCDDRTNLRNRGLNLSRS
jgi:hypothetical protein